MKLIKFILIALILLLCSCKLPRQIECEDYIRSLKVGQVLDTSIKWVKLKQATRNFETYVVDSGFAYEAYIKVRNDTIIEINYRMAKENR